MEKHILKFVWQHSRLQQIGIVILTLLAFPLLYLTLELPKWIINRALGDSSNPEKFLFGYALEPVPYLVALCVGFMVLIILSGLLKMQINTYKGIIGERLIRRLRFSLIDKLLRFPSSHYSRVSPGEMIATVSSETEPLAGYIGESIALPLFQGGTMITILIFMFAQDWVFGLVSIVLIPVQGYIIPKIQKQVNQLKKDRVRRVRKLSERIGETVTGASEIRLHGTERYTLAEFSRRFGDLFWVRLEIFKKKFYMKFLNNTIGQITPFLYYLFGGYLVIQGSLTIGALVAAISAYKDLTSPWRELLNHYQLHEDSKIKYQQIVEIFSIENLLIADQRKPADHKYSLPANIQAENIRWQNENRQRVINNLSFSIEAGSSIAIVGGNTQQRNKLVQIIAGIDDPDSGEITFGGKEISHFSNIAFRTRLAIQGSDPHIFNGSILDNLEYGLNQKEPYIEIEDSLTRDVVEALASGNTHPLTTDWVDYRIASDDKNVQNREWYKKIIHTIDVENVFYEKSLFEIIDPEEKIDLAESVLSARDWVRKKIAEANLEHNVTRFDKLVYNNKSSVLENILFGIPKSSDFSIENLISDAHLINILEESNIAEKGLATGKHVARRLIELQNDLPPGDPLLEHFGLSDIDYTEQVKEALDGFSQTKEDQNTFRDIFLTIFLKVIPDLHPFAGLDSRFAVSLLEARRLFNEQLPAHLAKIIIQFDDKKYHPQLSIQDNLLFGRTGKIARDDQTQINQFIHEAIEQEGIKTDLLILYGESQVGVGGSKLPLPVKHRIALGRAIMKRPDVLIFNDALGPLEEKDCVIIRTRIRNLLPDSTVIWVDREITNPLEFNNIYNFTESGTLLLDSEDATATSAGQGDTDVQPVDKFELVSDAILFSPLSQSQRKYLAEHSTIVTIPKNETIYRSGDTADAVWMVISGEVRSYRDTAHIGTFLSNDIFGSIEILADRDRMLTLTTTRPSRLLRVDGGALDSIASGNADVSRKLLRALTQQWGS